MNLIDLMEIWALKNNNTEPMGMLKQGEFDSRIDLDLLSGKIVEVCGAMMPVYNTTDSYSYFHKLFFKMWMPQIKRLLDTMDMEYEPLENFRRSEELNHNTTDTGWNHNQTDNTHENHDDGTADSKNKTSAFNESVYQPNEREDTTNHVDTTGKYNTTRQDSHEKKFVGKDVNSMHGLNGMYTSQQLLEQQRKVSEYNVYQWIVQKYMEELFICVF